MLSRENTEALCRVGAGTVMGDLMRQYWLPCVYSWELTPDGDPLRVRLLGEDLIAWRDTNGTPGFIANNCPHRGASLFFGRNEEAGIRCVHHGWKFDTSGQCVDMPNESPPSRTSRPESRQSSTAARMLVESPGSTWVRTRLNLQGYPSGSGARSPRTSSSTPTRRSTSATSCRPSKASWTPRTCTSCTPGSIRKRRRATGCMRQIGARTWRSWTPTTASCTRRAVTTRTPKRTTGAPPNSCSRSTACSPAAVRTARSRCRCMCRSTTCIRCTGACGGTPASRWPASESRYSRS
ncbi:MAG: Rieske 2Fe-2S domain-containing protein [Chloroflexi bacterium]|nr:MAG: Rieske 2Fe-2S domain-containing protein [Chloroflexota bacterium]